MAGGIVLGGGTKTPRCTLLLLCLLLEQWHQTEIRFAGRHTKYFNNASCIFNCDETGIPFNSTCWKWLTKSELKNTNYLTGCTKTQVTALACICATGCHTTLWLQTNQSWAYERWNTRNTLWPSSNGWIDMELLSVVILKYVPKCRPLVLLLDGHASHYHRPEVIKMVAKEKVIIFALLPNTTHLARPPIEDACLL